MIIFVFIYVSVEFFLDWDSHDAVIGPYPSSGVASWYRGLITASGESINSESLTCAMRKKDYGKYYQVCCVDNGNCVVVKHNDFGPRKKLFRQGRVIDLSHKAFESLAEHKTGLINVVITQVDKP